MFTLQNREQSQLYEFKVINKPSCVYPPKLRAVTTDERINSRFTLLCLPSKIESSYNATGLWKEVSRVVFTLQNWEQLQRNPQIIQQFLCCVYPPKLRAVTTNIIKIPSYLRLCLPSKIESSYNMIKLRNVKTGVVFTLQNWEQLQLGNGLKHHITSCVYPPKLRAVTTVFLWNTFFKLLCLPSKIESSYNDGLRYLVDCFVVFTLQNWEQLQQLIDLLDSIRGCVYPPKLRAVTTVDRFTR